MAWMNQEKKKAIAAELKKVVPADWKWTLGVRHHSTIVMTVAHTPKCVPDFFNDKPGDFSLNPYYPERGIHKEYHDTVKSILKALNLNNHDNSDAQTDYFDVGHYVELRFGLWNKPYTYGERA